MEINDEPNLFRILYSNSSLTKSADLTQFNLGTVAGKIAIYNFQWRFLTIVLTANIKSQALKTFLKYYNKTAVLIDDTRDVFAPRWPVSQLVLFGHEASDIATLKWNERLHLNARARIMIVCTTVSCDKRHLNKTLHDIGAHDVILLKPTDEKSQIQLYSHQLSMGSGCKLAHEKIKLLDVYCDNDACFKSLYNGVINFHGCPFVVSAVDNPPFISLTYPQSPSGLDGAVLKIIAQYLNATLKIITPEGQEEWGLSSENNTWTGPVSDLIQKSAHMAISEPLVRNKINGPFQVSIPYVFMDMIWITKAQKPGALWLKVMRPLKIRLRIAMLVIFALIAIVDSLKKTNAFRKIARYFQTTPPKRNLLFHSWIIFLGMPISRLTKKPTLLVLIYTWIWFCFIMRSSYLAALINCLKSNIFEDSVTSIEDAHKSGRRFGGTRSLREFYGHDSEIYDNWVIMSKSTAVDTLNAILNRSSDFVLACNEPFVAYVLKKSGRRMTDLLFLPHQIMRSPIVFYFHDQSILLEPVNRALRIIMEQGFMQLFKDMYYIHVDGHIPENYERLNCMHFQGAFFALLLGYSISLMYFIIEVITGKLKKKT